MKIPQDLPHFEKSPALFVNAGEYEAHFFIAVNGQITKENELKMPPREEAKEKQGFIGKRANQNLAAFSNRGRYRIDLKKKYSRIVNKIIQEIVQTYKLKEIYIFAPEYAARRLYKAMGNEERKLLRMMFNNEHLRANPLDLIRKFHEEELHALTHEMLSEEEEKIMRTPVIRRTLRKIDSANALQRKMPIAQ